MADRPRERAVLVATAAAACAVLAGCGTVPSDGAVRFGRSVSQGVGGLDDSDIHVLPPAPTRGQGPAEVVHGFLRASANFDDEHAIARLYLTAEAAARWHPDAGITIYDPARREPFPVDSGAVGSTRVLRLRAARVAAIGADGAYSVSPGVVDEQLRLVRLGGDWRLAGVPEGLLLTPTDVQRDLRSVYTYFLDPTQHTVVPDHVFLRAPARGRPTALIRALLDGPTHWLAPAVTTAFPPGTTLIGNAPLDGTVVVVNLSAEAARAGSAARAGMSAQLVWTLRQLPEITGVRIEVEGAPFEVPGAAEVQRVSDWSSFDPEPQASGAAFYFMQAGRLRTDEGAAAPGPLGEGALPLVRPAFGGPVVAGLTVSATISSLYAGPRTGLPTLRLRAPRGALTPPSVDGSGAVWTVRLDGRPAVLRMPRDADRPAEVSADSLLATGPVQELAVSRDGTRVAAVVGTGSARRLLVGRVVANVLGQPSLSGWRPVALALQGAVSVSWADSHRVALLARTGTAGPTSPWLVEADGSATETVSITGLPPGGPEWLAAGPDDDLLVATGDSVWRNSDGSWTSLGSGSDPTRAG